MRERVLNELKETKKGLSYMEISSFLSIRKITDLRKLSQLLRELEKENIMYLTHNKRYMLLENSHLLKGKLDVNKRGFGFVRLDEEGLEDVFIEKNKLNGAIEGDIVLIEKIIDRNHRDAGRVIKVIERSLKQIIGEYVDRGHYGDIIIDEEDIKINLRVNKKDSMGAVSGHKVAVKLISDAKKGYYYGKVIKIIGHKNEPGVDIATIACKYEFESSFNDDVSEELLSVPNEVREEDLKGRVDLRDKMIFTIDGNDTKDIDDAVTCYKKENGSFFLGVYIADLGAYVKENSALDQEAYKRGTSAYLADSVIPMYPPQLSNGICSLNPNVDRLCLACEMNIDGKGNIIDYKIFPGVINSRKQMTYDKVNDILEKNIIAEDYLEYSKMIHEMAELSDILRKNKIERGYIEFDSTEVKIKVDEKGKPIDIIPRVQRTGEKLIEDFMIIANETVATHMANNSLPFVYRIHDKPASQRIDDFLKFLSIMGIKITGDRNKFDNKTMQNIVNEIKGKKESRLVSTMLLRTMQKAVYAKNNIGHFGLGSKIYTHFTSPIRRYPDTIVNRLLHELVFDNNKQKVSKYDESLAIVAEHSSLRERAAVECEREVNAMKMAEYMESHIGEVYTGVISSITNFGMFIELDNLVEGLVRINTLGEYYEYREDLMALVATSSNKMYRLGAEVKVKVIAASKDNKTIDFEIYDKKENNNGNSQSGS